MNTKDLFVDKCDLKDHFIIFKDNYDGYINSLFSLIENKYEFTEVNKSNILATVLQSNDYQLASKILSSTEFKLPDIVRTCKILDSKRFAKQLRTKYDRLVANKSSSYKTNKCRVEMDATELLNEGLHLSLTSSRINFIRDVWIKSLNKTSLEYYTINYPVTKWKELLDCIHTKPSDFPVDWFQKFVYTLEAPKDNVIYIYGNLNKDNIAEMV